MATIIMRDVLADSSQGRAHRGESPGGQRGRPAKLRA
jgi:hypothetical protein